MFENLVEWNPWWEKKVVPDTFKGIERGKTKKMIKTLSMRNIKVVAGVRRSGKSTIMYQIIDELLKSGINHENVLYINLEDENLLSMNLDKILELYFQNFGVKDEIYLFLDEVQDREKWEFWVKKHYDLRKFKQIFVSGSSSSLLVSDYATLLTGRTLTFIVYPLEFKEFLRFKRFSFDKRFITKEKRAMIKRFLIEYMKYGGFPEVVLESLKKHQILVEYYNTIVEKDVVSKYSLERDKVVRLVSYLLSNVAKTHSYRRLGSLVNLSPTTVSTYLDSIQNSFLIFQVPIFSYKVKDQQQYPRKIYCVDTGLLNVTGFKFSEDVGFLVENLVFLELKRRFTENPLVEIYYWRDKSQKEVDFIIKEGLRPKELIQVCWNVEDEKTKKREVDALLKAIKEFKLKQGFVITEDYENEEKIDNKKIRFIPLWKWLLFGFYDQK